MDYSLVILLGNNENVWKWDLLGGRKPPGLCPLTYLVSSSFLLLSTPPLLHYPTAMMLCLTVGLKAMEPVSHGEDLQSCELKSVFPFKLFAPGTLSLR